MSYFHTYRAIWVRWLAVFALLIQAMMPLAQAVQVEDEFGDFQSLIVCTAYGLQQINIGSGEAPDNSQAQPESCPICLSLSLAQKMLTTADMAVLPGPAFVRLSWTVPRQDFSLTPILTGRQDARAPPLTA
ncbi:MAG: hypothetical protein C0605_12505 [Hyphomicrobiales bacterium]|nr:MAG: hypothetical protein C0605_12505 [Hyphomicrobiales bacterium]